jgi:hypothetical protein
MYGKDNRILYSARFSQGFKVVVAKRTWQAAGVSGGGTKIRVRQGAETQMAKSYCAGLTRDEIASYPLCSKLPQSIEGVCS